MILGDSLLVMASLAERRAEGQGQMIYMDPPYGIKFNSNWQISTRKRDVTDGKPEDLTGSRNRSAPFVTHGRSDTLHTSPI